MAASTAACSERKSTSISTFKFEIGGLTTQLPYNRKIVRRCKTYFDAYFAALAVELKKSGRNLPSPSRESILSASIGGEIRKP